MRIRFRLSPNKGPDTVHHACLPEIQFRQESEIISVKHNRQGCNNTLWKHLHCWRILYVLFTCILVSCEPKPEYSSIDPVNWSSRSATLPVVDSLHTGSTYLSVYSEIYSLTEHRTHNLTATISMRNTNRQDTVYIRRADYYGTEGNLLRTYFENPIYLGPMETVEIVIDEIDESGGTGANFLFDWTVAPGVRPPLFEGVMISTSGQQGLSFTTQGIVVKVDPPAAAEALMGEGRLDQGGLGD